MSGLNFEDRIWIEGHVGTADAEAWLDVSRRTVFRKMSDGTLAWMKVGGRRRIAIASLRRLVPFPAAGIPGCIDPDEPP